VVTGDISDEMAVAPGTKENGAVSR